MLEVVKLEENVCDKLPRNCRLVGEDNITNGLI